MRYLYHDLGAQPQGCTAVVRWRGSGADVLLLDEPMAGVNPTLAAAMERHIRARHAAGTTFLVVEHDMGVVMRLCDPVIVLDQGHEIFTGPPTEVRHSPLVLDAYLGA